MCCKRHSPNVNEDARLVNTHPGMGFRLAPPVNLEGPEALRSAGPTGGVFPIPEDLGAACQLQRPVPLEVEEHEARARLRLTDTRSSTNRRG